MSAMRWIYLSVTLVAVACFVVVQGHAPGIKLKYTDLFGKTMLIYQYVLIVFVFSSEDVIHFWLCFCLFVCFEFNVRSTRVQFPIVTVSTCDKYCGCNLVMLFYWNTISQTIRKCAQIAHPGTLSRQQSLSSGTSDVRVAAQLGPI